MYGSCDAHRGYQQLWRAIKREAADHGWLLGSESYSALVGVLGGMLTSEPRPWANPFPETESLEMFGDFGSK